jgi:molecular chaperone DnaJ
MPAGPQQKDYYGTLGIKKTATPDEIRKAFRKLARKHHPDVNPGDKKAEDKFK